jgi:DNA-binding NarL/FixJ family response regulator
MATEEILQREPQLSIVTIDDHDVIGAGIAAWCSQADPPIQVLAHLTSITSFLEQFPDPTDVDVVVVDLEMGRQRPAFPALRRICGAGYTVVVFSHLSSDEVILSCLRAGAASFIVKHEGKTHLLTAIEAAASATPYTGPRMAAAMANDKRDGRPGLTKREKEVLIAWSQTASKGLVARKLNIEETTVKTHLNRIRAKYAAVNRPAPNKASLIARAIQEGLIGPDDL